MKNLSGKHLIAGKWLFGETTFQSKPASGASHEFANGTSRNVDDACEAAEKAFWSFGYSTREMRAEFLNTIAEEIEARGDALTQIGTQETGLPEARLNGERGRTTGQLRLFAEHILKGDYLDRRHDEALPDRQPLPRPDIKMMQRPIGPVAVFGASNFPLAFSTAGGDTAAAFAAGCPVVVKGHPAHPGTGEIVAQAIDAAIQKCDLHPGVFSFVQGDTMEVGGALVSHPKISAVGFTGSLGGGRALYNLCAQRPQPIPFFGELGSVNPMFILPDALKNRGSEIAAGWAGSLTMGAGQFCTNPGIALVIKGAQADDFIRLTGESLGEAGAQTMLTDGIADAYRKGAKTIQSSAGISEILATACDQREAKPNLFATTGDNWLQTPELGEEVFGPLGLVVIANDFEQMLEVAHSFQGQLTATLQLDDADMQLAAQLTPILERKAGRLLVNGFPTGVEVSEAMVHGGPYPASTNFGATSVGTLSIRRFLRPVCYQNMPDELLPKDLG